MRIVTIDFETFYSRDYSLSKMTTEAYVRRPEFEVIGLGVKDGKKPTVTYTGDDVQGFLDSFDLENAAILCHNTLFDGAILSWRYGIKPKFWLDTLSMAKPLHKVTVGGSLKALAKFYKLGIKGTEIENALGKHKSDFTKAQLDAYMEYCANDVELTYDLFKHLARDFPQEELQVIDMTIRMYTEPKIVLDTDLLKRHLVDVQERKQKLLDGLGGTEQAKKMLMSNEMFARLLRKMGVEPPTKVSPATGKTAYAFAKTDKEFTDLLEHENPMVAAIVEARLGVKSTIEETRTQALIEAAGRGRLPIMLNYYGAHTGRFSGGDGLNLQNLPSRKNNTIRRALTAPPGYKLMAVDSSQIEARMVAYLAGQDDLVQAFREGRDVYSEFATDIYGYKVDKSKKIERFVGKTCILGLGYGMGHAKLKDTLESGAMGLKVDIDEFEAKRIINVYRNRYSMIAQFWDTCNNALRQMLMGNSGEVHPLVKFTPKGFQLPNGLFIQYPGLMAEGNQVYYISDSRLFQRVAAAKVSRESLPTDKMTKIYGGKAVENVVQAMARLVITDQMKAISKLGYHVTFQVHDEIICTVPEDRVEQAYAELLEVMAAAPKWAPDLPVACEGGYGDNYGDIEK